MSSANKIWQVTTSVSNLHVWQLKSLPYRQVSSPWCKG